MKYRPYSFNENDVYRFAKFIGAKTRQRGKELEFKECCYCHGKGVGNEYKFSISLETGVFHCFRNSCGREGNLVTLSQDFDFSLGNEVDEYYAPKKRFKTYKLPKTEHEPKDEAVKYLESRGISRETAKKYRIGLKQGTKDVIAMPHILDDEICMVKYRNTNPNSNVKEYQEKDGKPILFGMAQCNLENKTLIVTEGHLDCLSVSEAGIENAVSVPNGVNAFTWVPYCCDWMDSFKTIIVFGDHEKGRITLVDDFKKRFKKWEIKHVKEEDYKECKDANDILRKYGKNQLKACIENAITLPVRHTIDLADIEEPDIYRLEKLPTGIDKLDRFLHGGLPFGGVHILTGSTGCGKSTFASQILVKAISVGKKCFAYSGELPNYLFRAWMTFQVVGRKHIVEYADRWGDKGYSVSKTNKSIASEFYRGMIRIYDASDAEDDEVVGLLNVIEETIIRYGAEVILIDNLMTAMEDDFSKGDEYSRQGVFVNRLMKLATEFNVLIILVAHKRKNGYSKDENSEVMGSSKITNLGMLTISYEKDSDLREDQRMLRIAKNRLFGNIDTKGIVLNFDEKSKRIYGEGDNVDHDYGWKKEAALDEEDNPFV